MTVTTFEVEISGLELLARLNSGRGSSKQVPLVFWIELKDQFLSYPKKRTPLFRQSMRLKRKIEQVVNRTIDLFSKHIV